MLFLPRKKKLLFADAVVVKAGRFPHFISLCFSCLSESLSHFAFWSKSKTSETNQSETL
jgi:hypothetical protein